ncbi:MAG: hypothetical protein AAGA25_15455 [Planctomycetota bacterium]
MRSDLAELIDEANVFLDEFFGEGIPIQHVLREGCLPEGWADRYLRFVDKVEQVIGPDDPLPREVVAVMYNASVYGTKRFFDWQRLGANPLGDTTSEISEVRRAGDRVLLGPYFNRPEN